MGYDHWNTPPEVLDVVRQLGPIALDPCSNGSSQVRAGVAFDIQEGNNGLTIDWRDFVWNDPGAGPVFVNPPYSYLPTWVGKASTEAAKGLEVVFLGPSVTDARWWHQAAKSATAVAVWCGRIRFWRNGVRGKATPREGSSFFYWGRRPVEFARAFYDHATVTIPVRA